jgi:flavin-dependent dehydrogenase
MKRTSGHGTLLVGDSCGFIDPFTGEGINYAFQSADIAVNLLVKTLHTGDLSALERYDWERRRIFSRKFRMARLLQKAVQWPGLSDFLVARFARSLSLGDTVVSAVGSTIPVERIWSLRFLMKVMIS